MLPPQSHPHYLLTQRSLNLLLSDVWAVAASPPDYYRTAMVNRTNAEKRLLQARSQASASERRLERERSRQYLQAEEIGFLLTALTETATSPAAEQADSQPGVLQQDEMHDADDGT